MLEIALLRPTLELLLVSIVLALFSHLAGLHSFTFWAHSRSLLPPRNGLP